MADYLFQAAKPGSGSVLKAPVKLSDEISIIPTKKTGDKDKVRYNVKYLVSFINVDNLGKEK